MGPPRSVLLALPVLILSLFLPSTPGNGAPASRRVRGAGTAPSPQRIRPPQAPTALRSSPSRAKAQRHAHARALVARARDALRHRRFRTAIQALRAAYRIWPRNVLWFNLCVAYLAKGDRYRAARALHRYLRHASAADQASVPAKVRAVLNGFGILTVRAPQQTLSIWLNGRFLGSDAVTVVLRPGQHVVEIRQDNQVLARESFSIASGQTLIIRPTPVPFSVPRRPSTRQIRHPRRRARARLHWAYFVASAGLALGTAAAFTYTGLRAKEMERAWAEDPLPSYRDRGRAYMLATNVLIGVSAACGLTAVLVALFTRWHHGESSGTLLLPQTTATSLSLSLRGRF